MHILQDKVSSEFGLYEKQRSLQMICGTGIELCCIKAGSLQSDAEPGITWLLYLLSFFSFFFWRLSAYLPSSLQKIATHSLDLLFPFFLEQYLIFRKNYILLAGNRIYYFLLKHPRGLSISD